MRKPSRRRVTGPFSCDCWEFEDVTQAEQIVRKLDVQHKEMLAAIATLTSAIHTQTETIGRVGQDVYAVNENVKAEDGVVATLKARARGMTK